MSDETWQVVNTAPRLEPFVRDNIDRLGFTTFLPLLRERLPDRRWRVGPLFPRYLFVQFAIDEGGWGALLNQQGVISVLRSTRFTPASVPNGIIDDIQARAALQPDGVLCNELPHGPLIRRGTKARIVEGPFEGIEGICTRSSAERVWLLLNILGGQRQVALGRHQVVQAA